MIGGRDKVKRNTMNKAGGDLKWKELAVISKCKK
jgi:hypothetical protein